MPVASEDLHGNVPDESRAVLLLIDVINDMEFDGGDALLAAAMPAVERIAALKARARAAGIPSVHVNDNFGRWRSDFRTLVRHCLDDDVRGRPIARLLAPDADDYFVLKPKHSAFFATPLHLLLTHFGARTLVLTGLTAEGCVLFSASDAYMRDFRLVVPSDCVASASPGDCRRSLEHMRKTLKADTRPAAEIDLTALTERR